jgi:ribosome-associated protein
MTSFPLRGEHVTLANAVKVVGLADTGGQAKHLVRSGAVRVNGDVATQPAKKLRAGDRLQVGDQEWTVTSEAPP